MSDDLKPQMRRHYWIALYAFVALSCFYALSGVLGIVLAGIELAGPPPEAEIPVASPLARMFGSLLVVGLLGLPGIVVLVRRRDPRVLRFLKIGGIGVTVLHSLLAALSLEAPRGITLMLLALAILGVWITLVAFHPLTDALHRESERSASGV